MVRKKVFVYRNNLKNLKKIIFLGWGNLIKIFNLFRFKIGNDDKYRYGF